MKPRTHFHFAWLCLAFGLAGMTAPAQSEKFPDQWIAAQANLRTWSGTSLETVLAGLHNGHFWLVHRDLALAGRVDP